MKRIVVFAVLCILLVGCTGKSHDPMAELQRSVEAYTNFSHVPLQRNLAKWYNLNSHSQNPDPGFREAYRNILAIEGDVMGYAEFPVRERILPIYHDGAERGLVHSALSDFPIGGMGNHTVLTCWEPLRLQQGEEIVICILDDRLRYQMGEDSGDVVILICGNASYTLGRVAENG